MNCEKCKNKKATLFYADEGGVRHALCAACGGSMNKISELCEKNQSPTAKFIPERTLYSFYERQSAVSPYILRAPDDGAICSSCGATLDEIIKQGRFSCSDCYECFEDYLAHPQGSEKDKPISRMPSSRRADIDRLRALESLRAEIKLAIEKENYELAATLRDKAKKLEYKL